MSGINPGFPPPVGELTGEETAPFDTQNDEGLGPETVAVTTRALANFATGLVQFATQAQLRADGSYATASAGLQVSVGGYAVEGDGGGGEYYWNATSTASDNIGTVINPTGNTGHGRWLFLDLAQLSVKAFGATGNGVTNDNAAFVAAAAAAPYVYVPSGTYLVNSNPGAMFYGPGGLQINGGNPIQLPNPPTMISPFYPVIQPSSGNLQGNGIHVRHQLVWSDTNTSFSANYLGLASTDPSALCTIILGGTVTVGDVLTVNFLFNALTIPISVTAQAGDTTTTLATAMKNAIKANASLYIPAVLPNTVGGGLPGQILFVAPQGGATIYFDYNVNVPMTMSSSVTGAGTETITLPNSGSPLPTILDANPLIILSRSPGVAPAAGSNIGQLLFASSSSSAPSSITVQYGSITCDVINSTAGVLSARLLLGTCNPVTGGIDRGLYIGQGIWTPLATGNDRGVGACNISDSYYVNNVKIGTQRRYDSSPQTITAGGALVLVHGLPNLPSVVQSFLVCVNGEGGYTAGNIVAGPICSQDTNRGVSLHVAGSVLNVRFGSDANSITVLRKDTGASFPITNANWTIYFSAFSA